MSDPEKGSTETNSAKGDHPVVYERPKGLKGLYLHPITQVSMLGLVCFMCPGLFNALTGLGGGGQVDSTTNSKSNTALYATFAGGAFFAGSINNKLGSRLTLQIGSFGYALFIGSYLSMNMHPNSGAFVIAAGAILGICAGLLWTAQGSLMLAYPTETEKGKFIAIFWGIFNLGAVVGASVSLGQNIHSKANRVGDGTYIGFLVLTLIGVLIPMAMADPKKMIRTDGTRVSTPRQPTWKSEIKGLWVALRTDPMIILLFPLFLSSNWFYTWQFSAFNGAIFNIRTRSLNNLLYWTSQIIGSLAIGVFLDRPNIGRRVRAFAGWGILFVLVFVIHIWGYFYQKQYTRAMMAPEDAVKIDFKDKRYVGRVFFYIGCGILDAMWQTTAYWLMGAMSNDPGKLAYFTGFYKSIQSAGAAGMWSADGNSLAPYMNMFISTWVLLVAGLVFAFPMIYLRVKDTTVLADETIARMDADGHVQPTEVVAEKLERSGSR